MSRSVSIHIGVNVPQGRMSEHPLQYSEGLAWRMASLAKQAGYESVLVLRGKAATRKAVHDALTAAAGSLSRGDLLFVYFAGHGCQEADRDGEDRDGWDEALCLYDAEIVDDQLSGYLRLFEPGVRILLVVDGCHSGGMARDDEEEEFVRQPTVHELAPAPASETAGSTMERVMRGEIPDSPPSEDAAIAAGDEVGSCIVSPPHGTDGIRASVLLLASAREDQKAQEGLFTFHLLDLWNEGRFPGTYCDLYWQVREKVMAERGPRQEPQIRMMGNPDRGFPLERAFLL